MRNAPSSSAIMAPRFGHAAVSHNGRLIVLGGQSSDTFVNDVWSSRARGPDGGKKWSLQTKSAEWKPRIDFAAVSFGGKLLVMGGTGLTKTHKLRRYNDVWESSDNGQRWVSLSENANGTRWNPRSSFQVRELDGKLHLVGGWNKSTSQSASDSFISDEWVSEEDSDVDFLGRPAWTPRSDCGACSRWIPDWSFRRRRCNGAIE